MLVRTFAGGEGASQAASGWAAAPPQGWQGGAQVCACVFCMQGVCVCVCVRERVARVRAPVARDFTWHVHSLAPKQEEDTCDALELVVSLSLSHA